MSFTQQNHSAPTSKTIFRCICWSALAVLSLFNFVNASPQAFEPLIRIDQFGYLPGSEKVAILSNPVIGYNNTRGYEPGEILEVREWATDALMYSAAPTQWNNGQIHEQSGDAGYWFNFTPLSQQGTYYIYDPLNDVGSFPFVIATNVYNTVLEVAIRTFFIQRLGIDKLPPYVDVRWADTASYLGPNQDTEARNRWDKENPETARDVSGGWMDAGDPNKYTTFAATVVAELLEAYRLNPGVFTDRMGIPESGNGIPDLIDEVKYELDWLCRAQDATGTGGVILKVGVDNHNSSIPLSTDARARYYVPECTSSTLSGAAMFSMAAWILKDIPQLTSYAEDMKIRAVNAWERGKTTTQNFTEFENDCDDQNITSGDADQTDSTQLGWAVVSAAYLHMLTKEPEYESFVFANYQHIPPIADYWWGPYNSQFGRTLLEYADWQTDQRAPVYTTETEETNEVELPEFISIVRNQKLANTGIYSIPDFESQKDLYRAHLDDSAHHWGSNSIRARAGHLNLDYVNHNLLPEQNSKLITVAEQYLHWMHGANAIGKVMLSNMYAYGAENSVNEFYHTWFADGSPWDSVFDSYGPAPGYVVGGPNKDCSTSLAPPANQPPQKSYKDFNSGYPENSWELTENAIYYQSSYILLLSQLIPAQSVVYKNDPAFAPDLTANARVDESANRWLDVVNLPEGGWIASIQDFTGNTLLNVQPELESAATRTQSISLNAITQPGVYYVEVIQADKAAVRKFEIQ